MKSKKITAECQHMLDNASAKKEHSVLIRSKAKSISQQEALMAFEKLKNEQLVTKRSALLRKIEKRFGVRKKLIENFKDSQLNAQHKLLETYKGVSKGSWLAGVIAVSGTKKEILDITRNEDVELVDQNLTFESPKVFQTPLEGATSVVDGSTWGLAKILAPEVWGGFGRGNDVLIGHLDTGVDHTHPALTGKIHSFEEFDNLGAPIGAPAPRDSGSHGTHTAGTMVGRNFNGVNIGVAPDARLCSALVLNGGSGSFAQIVGGMEWALDQGVHVINMSLGANGYSTVWNLPILLSVLSGVNVVASIGNAGQGTSGGPGNDLFAIGVGATHNEDVAAGFSAGQTLLNVFHSVLSPFAGPLTYQKPDISAPGVGVLSCVPRRGMAAFNGTSMAAPHVAAAVALLLSAEPSLKNDPFAVRNILLGAGREDLGNHGKDQRFGFGRLDALSATETAIAMAS